MSGQSFGFQDSFENKKISLPLVKSKNLYVVEDKPTLSV